MINFKNILSKVIFFYFLFEIFITIVGIIEYKLNKDESFFLNSFTFWIIIPSLIGTILLVTIIVNGFLKRNSVILIDTIIALITILLPFLIMLIIVSQLH